ncbi:MAG: AmmeMemoRadiSam system protein B [Candidatus Eisenbacteria bacterium]|nr:AmmeMemoRadiSam system protein B [Candidatus Eisenbacteria bacterium]
MKRIRRAAERRAARLLVPAIACALLLPGTAGCAGDAGNEGPGVREPAVAGSFYPEDPDRLRLAVRAFLNEAPVKEKGTALAILAPHAGYIYSGQIAADAWRQAAELPIETVVILGTNHTTAPFRGASVWGSGAYGTPLGDAPVDAEFAARLREEDDRFVFRADTHRKEHSVEVQVPFAQILFPEARIVPMVIGDKDAEMCRALGRAIGRIASPGRTLIVASTDLSHYPAYDDAVRSDHAVLRAVASLDPSEVKRTIAREMDRGAADLSTCACGEGPILVAMHAALEMGADHATVVSYANSGMAAIGNPDRVVGYGAVAFSSGGGGTDLAALESPAPAREVDGPLTGEQRAWLIDLARRSVEQYMLTGTAPLARPDDPALLARRGAFVTLKKRGELRGCIGHMKEDLPLARTVGAMALQAAFNDRRFQPVQWEEWRDITVEISVLTPFREIDGPEKIVIGRDGVLLKKDGRSAVYLPQVAPEQGWDREETLDHLCAKAGLPGGCWKRGAALYTFQAEVFAEEGDAEASR